MSHATRLTIRLADLRKRAAAAIGRARPGTPVSQVVAAPRDRRTGRYVASATVVERFWSKVDRQPDDGCWLWTGEPDRRAAGRWIGELGALQGSIGVSLKTLC
jgi:hypothetical protein